MITSSLSRSEVMEGPNSKVKFLYLELVMIANVLSHQSVRHQGQSRRDQENLHMAHSGSAPRSPQSLVLDAEHWVHQLIVDMH